MSSLVSSIKKESKNITEIFNFDGNKDQLKHIKDVFTNMIKNSKNEPKYYITFLERYSKCRVKQHDVSRELVECVYSCFPEQINEIKQNIKKTKFLKYIIFPEEFPIEGSEEQKEMILLLQRDDLVGFLSFLSKNPTIDITKYQKFEDWGYYFHLFNLKNRITLISLCCYFGSVNCFKYLLSNQCRVEDIGIDNTIQFAIEGGNQEIIDILKEKGYSFKLCLQMSVLFHRYELTKWLSENYKSECLSLSLPMYISNYYFDEFLYMLEHGHSIDETGILG